MTDIKKSRDLFPDVISIGALDTYVRNSGTDMIFKDPRTSSEVTLTALRTKSITLQSNGVTVGHPIVLNFSTSVFGISLNGNVATLSVSTGAISHNSLGGLQGGPSTYYHLTLAQHDGLTNGGSTTLHVHPVATDSTAGFLSAADKTKLDGIASGAPNYTIGSGLSVSSNSLSLNLRVQNGGTDLGVPITAINFIGGASASLSGNTAIITAGNTFSGDVASTTNGYLSNSNPSTPVTVKNDSGFAIDNTAGTQGNLTRVVYGTTTDATPTELTIDNGGIQFFTLASGTTHTYVVYLTAKGTSGTNIHSSGSWQLQACLSNISGTTQIIGNGGYLKTVVGKDVSGWDVNLTANNANSRLSVTVTGDSSTGITWSGWVAETII